jgi:hypothetical protein
LQQQLVNVTDVEAEGEHQRVIVLCLFLVDIVDFRFFPTTVEVAQAEPPAFADIVAQMYFCAVESDPASCSLLSSSSSKCCCRQTQ